MSNYHHFQRGEQLANFKILTANDFDEVIHHYPLIIIDFWATWCIPCQTFATTFINAAKEFPDILFAAVNIEAEQSLATDFQICSVPSIMIIRNSVIIFAQAGQMPTSALRDLLNQARQVDVDTTKDKTNGTNSVS